MSKTKTIRKFDEEFKRRAVQLFRSGWKSYRVLAEELGISVNTLHGWIKPPRYMSPTGTNGEDNDVVRQFKALRRELSIVKEERDILKKALAIFSGDVPRN